MAKIISKRVLGPDDPIYTGRWILSPMPVPKKSKKTDVGPEKGENKGAN